MQTYKKLITEKSYDVFYLCSQNDFPRLFFPWRELRVTNIHGLSYLQPSIYLVEWFISP